jgi:hypothetical protein
MTINPVFHARSKHIELDYHFVRERVAIGLLVTKHVSSANQVTDIFTKPVPKAALAFFHNKLCLLPRLSLRGDISNLQPHVSNNHVSLSHKSWSDNEELWSNKDDHTHRHIKENMVGDKDFHRVTNSYANGSSPDKGNSN